MATPTQAEIETQLKDLARIWDESRLFGHANTPNFIGMQDTHAQAIEGDWSSRAVASVADARAAIASTTDAARIRSYLDDVIREMGKFRSWPERDPEDILDRWYDQMITDTERVTERNFTFGSVALGGSNVGNGTVYRLTADKNDLDIENTYAQVVTLECLQDEHSGGRTAGEESFEIRGQDRELDDILVSGSGNSGNVKSLSGADSKSLLKNPSFGSISGSAGAVTAFTGWTPTTLIGNFDVDTTNFYRTYQGEGTAQSMKLSANDSLYQDLSEKKVTVSPLVPHILLIRWNGTVGSAVGGTITLTLGSQTATVSVAQSGWQNLLIPMDKESWYDTWKQAAPQVKIGWGTRTSGYLLFDDIIFAPMFEFDGLWYAVVGGNTQWQRNDSASFTDTEAGAIIQTMLWRGYNKRLPPGTGGAITLADPT